MTAPRVQPRRPGLATFSPAGASNLQLELCDWSLTMNFLARCVLTLCFAFGAVLVGDAAGAADDISKVNGSVKVEPGQQAGDVDTVNGSITVGAGARVGGVETVNGSLRLDDGASADSAGTVNGSITIGADAVVQNRVEAVNGSITLRKGARVAGGLENVNGAVTVEGAQVDGGIATVNGDIRLASGSRLTGGIRVEESKSWWKGGNSRNPRITIEQGAVVEGPFNFEREVDLYVAPGVTVPAVEGVAPRRYTLE
jgi:DUF4097 and DUF4098 domain-containing protein YvlB